MPYKQIHWIKLEKRLLNDPRFFTMTEKAQLFYVKLLLLCAEYNNKITKNKEFLRQIMRVGYNDETIGALFNEVKKNFPKLKETKGFYAVSGFEKLHNRVSPGSSQGVPREDINKIRETYVRMKGWKNEELSQTDIERFNDTISKLLTKSKGNTNQVYKAIAWVAKRGYVDWTLETVIKKWLNFLKHCPKCNDTGKYTSARNYEVTCECREKKSDNPRL